MRHLLVALLGLTACDRVFDVLPAPSDAAPDDGRRDARDDGPGACGHFTVAATLATGRAVGAAGGIAIAGRADGRATIIAVAGDQRTVFAAAPGPLAMIEQTVPLEGSHFVDVVAGRFDGDDVLDSAVLVSGANDRLELATSATPFPPYGVSSGARYVVADDRNGDGLTDLAWLAVDALQGTTNGPTGFGNADTVPVTSPTAFAYARFESGNLRRPVVISRPRHTVETLPGTGIKKELNAAPLDIASAVESGVREWVAVPTDANQIELFEIVNLVPIRLPPITAPVGVRRVLLADMDRDGLTDIVALGAQRLEVLRQSAPAAFTPWAMVTLPETGADVAVGSLTDDDLPDLAVLSAQGNVVVLASCD